REQYGSESCPPSSDEPPDHSSQHVRRDTDPPRPPDPELKATSPSEPKNPSPHPGSSIRTNDVGSTVVFPIERWWDGPIAMMPHVHAGPAIDDRQPIPDPDPLGHRFGTGPHPVRRRRPVLAWLDSRWWSPWTG